MIDPARDGAVDDLGMVHGTPFVEDRDEIKAGR
jgi:hypothetical protein